MALIEVLEGRTLCTGNAEAKALRKVEMSCGPDGSDRHGLACSTEEPPRNKCVVGKHGR